MSDRQEVHILYYRYAGDFLFFHITKRCEECDITYAVLQRLMADVFHDKRVTLEVRPWLDNWWRVLLRGGWHAPIVMVNGRVFSQGIVPDVRELVWTVADALDDEDLRQRAEESPGKRRMVGEGDAEVVVYHSPACPHCRRLLAYLDENDVEYLARDVSESYVAREDLQRLTGRLAIPVTKVGEDIAEGLDRARLRTLLGIPAEAEKVPEREAKAHAPEVARAALEETVERAKELLAKNRSEGRTRASSHLYPHQWNWDSGFIARGYLRYEPPLAYDEMRSLFSGQWRDGFLPHIIFNPDYLDYFPGPGYWKANRSPAAPEGVHTSGISQPPVHATMLWPAPEFDGDNGRAGQFLAEIYPRLKALHDYYFKHRDPEGEGLVSLVHPWESGLDNAPIWDEPLSRIDDTSPWAREMQARYDELAEQNERPKRSYIEKYSFLVESLFSRDYDWQAILADHPFVIQDVLFNSVLCRSERDLGRIAEAIGEDPAPHYERADRMARAMNEKLWDESAGLYYSYDVVADSPIRRDTIFSYLPLFAAVCDEDRADRVMENLRSHCFCVADRDCVGVPTYDMCQADFQGEFYWRGPVWFNMCWYMAKGLRNYGNVELADWIERSLLRLVVDRGFYEYYDPETGKGLGADGFSWTAALFIDLAGERL